MYLSMWFATTLCTSTAVLLSLFDFSEGRRWWMGGVVCEFSAKQHLDRKNITFCFLFRLGSCVNSADGARKKISVGHSIIRYLNFNTASFFGRGSGGVLMFSGQNIQPNSNKNPLSTCLSVIPTVVGIDLLRRTKNAPSFFSLLCAFSAYR
jgi:hypothetical protein